MSNPLYRRDVSETSLTASDLGTPGTVRREPNGKLYKLFKASASLSHGAPVAYAAAATDGYTVGANPGNRPSNGVYNVGTANLAADAYFWGQVRGVGPVLNGGVTEASNQYLIGSTAGAVSVASTISYSPEFKTLAAADTVTVTFDMQIFCEE